MDACGCAVACLHGTLQGWGSSTGLLQRALPHTADPSQPALCRLTGNSCHQCRTHASRLQQDFVVVVLGCGRRPVFVALVQGGLQSVFGGGARIALADALRQLVCAGAIGPALVELGGEAGVAVGQGAVGGLAVRQAGAGLGQVGVASGVGGNRSIQVGPGCLQMAVAGGVGGNSSVQVGPGSLQLAVAGRVVGLGSSCDNLQGLAGAGATLAALECLKNRQGDWAGWQQVCTRGCCQIAVRE